MFIRLSKSILRLLFAIDSNNDNILSYQFIYNVRGSRYPYYFDEYLSSLLKPHEYELKKQFNISILDIVGGLYSIWKNVRENKLLAHINACNIVNSRPAILNEASKKEILNTYFNIEFNLIYNDISNITS